jgi:hypothetical protein
MSKIPSQKNLLKASSGCFAHQEKVAGFPRAATAVATTTTGSSAETACEESPSPSADEEASVSARKESSQAFPSRRGQPTRPSVGAEQKVAGASAWGGRRQSSADGEAHGCGGEEMKRTRRRGWPWWCELAWPGR